jgi:hypothetical protein
MFPNAHQTGVDSQVFHMNREQFSTSPTYQTGVDSKEVDESPQKAGVFRIKAALMHSGVMSHHQRTDERYQHMLQRRRTRQLVQKKKEKLKKKGVEGQSMNRLSTLKDKLHW